MEARDLDRGEDTTDDERRAHKVLLLRPNEVGRACEDDWRRYDTGKHRQSMLEAKEKRQEDRHAVVETEERRSSSLTLHERDLRLEQECVVVGADEAILGRESSPEAFAFLPERALWCMMRCDCVWTVVLDVVCASRHGADYTS